MRKRILALFLTVCLLVGVLPAGVLAVERDVVTNGVCGENLTWELSDGGKLTISGQGDMYNYDFERRSSQTPWWKVVYLYGNAGDITDINEVVVNSGVTSIGNCAFCWCGVTDITIPTSVTYIGADAFTSSNEENTLKNIYYAGNEAQWKAIKKDTTIPTGATIHYVEKTGFSVEKDGWSFVNGYEGFSYPEHYSIPAERYEEVFGTAYVAAASQGVTTYKSMVSEWGGNCFGMSATSILFYLGLLDWDSYNERYIDDFPTVNSYFAELRYENYNEVFSSSDCDTAVTNLIERYQILQNSGVNYVYGDASTASLLDDYFWEYDAENSFEGSGTTPEGIGQPKHSVERYEIRKSGKYIEMLLNEIQNSEIPLGLGMQFDGGAHCIVTRTDKAPEDMGNGWWRVYVYDPNTPYLNSDLVPAGSWLLKNVLRSYYINYLHDAGDDRYIELNPKENKWRYLGSVNAGIGGEYHGCDVDGNVKNIVQNATLLNGNTVHTVVPEYIICMDFSSMPTSFNGKEPLGDSDEAVSVAFTGDSSFAIYAENGDVVCIVNDGELVKKDSRAAFVPYIGNIADSQSSSGGKVILPYHKFNVEYITGEDISIIGPDSVINLAALNPILAEVSIDEGKIELEAPDINQVMTQVTSVYDSDIYTSAALSGTLHENDSIEIQLDGDDLVVNGELDDGSDFGLSTKNEQEPEERYLGQIQEGNEYVSERVRGSHFVDVQNPNEWYYDAVLWAVSKRITTGVTTTEFQPNANCTRAQAVTFLWRAAGCPQPTISYNPFVDVPYNANTDWYYNAVLWAYENGITTGTDANHFSPNGTVSRGQMVTFLWRMHGQPAVSGSTFVDVPGNAYYYNAVSWAVSEGVTNGTNLEANIFEPNSDCTRAQIVTFLYRDFVG